MLFKNTRNVCKQEFNKQEQNSCKKLIINSENCENSVPTDIVNENLKVSVSSEETPNQHFLRKQNSRKVISEKASNKRQFVCNWSECGKRFTTETHLNQHKRFIHLKEKPFKCNFKDCGQSFFNKHQLIGHKLKHKRIHSAEKSFVVKNNEFGKSFKLKSHLNQNKQLMHSRERRFECYFKDCEKKYFDKYSLIYHKLTHSGEKPFVCDHKMCQKRFRGKSTLYRHKRTVHKKGMQFKKTRNVSKIVFNKQEQNNSKKLTIDSENCENSVPTDIVTENLKGNVGSEETQNQHFLRKQSQSKEFSDKVSNKRQFVCDWIRCQKRFTTKSRLNQHKQYIHLKEKPFKCNFKDCGQSFFNEHQLIGHKLVHSTEKPFSSDPTNCPKRFRQKLILVQHNRTVQSKGRRFKCDYKNCWKRFTAKQTLIDHKLIHSGEKPFACDHKNCQIRFRQKSNLTRHKRNVHKKEMHFKKTRNVCKRKLYKQEQNNCNQLIIDSENYENSVPTDIITENLKVSLGSEKTPNQHFLRKETQSKNISEKASNKQQFVCDWSECGKRFTTKSHLNQHKQYIHLKKNPFKCDFKDCGKYFFNKHQLNGHKSIHSKKYPLIGNQNKYRKRSRQILPQIFEQNRTIHLKDRPFQCDYKNCWKRFPRKQSLIDHKHIHSGEKSFVCDQNKCQIRFRHKSNLTRHKRTVHSKKMEFKKAREIYEKELKIHEQMTSNQLIINSENVDNTVQEDIVTVSLKVSAGSEETTNQHFLNNESQSKDISEEVSNKQFVCDWIGCGIRFTTKSSLNQHKRFRHLKDRQFVCDYTECGMKFFNKSHLIGHKRKHKRIHSEKRPFICDNNKCRKSFGKKSQLYIHKQIFHLKEKLLEKPPEANKQELFNQEQIISKQLIFNSENDDNSVQKDIVIENLKASVGSEETRNQHFMNNESQSKDIWEEVSNRRQFVCDWSKCGKRFITNQDLIKHKRYAHLKDLPFKCDYPDCGKGFTNKQQLRKHKRIIHFKEKQLKKSRDVYKQLSHNQEQIASNQLIVNSSKSDNSVPTDIVTENLKVSVVSEETPNQHFVNNENEIKNITEEVSNKPQIVCNLIRCRKQFTTKLQLYAHNRTVHLKERRFECDYKRCGKRFFIKQNLFYHKLIHLREKPFFCDHKNCHKRFSYKSALNKHKRRVHSKERQLVKPLEINKQELLNQGQITSKHLIVNSEKCENSVPTDIVSKKLKASVGSEETPNYDFVYNESQTKDISEEVSNKQIVCKCIRCGKRFTYKSHLNQHNRNVHLKEGLLENSFEENKQELYNQNASDQLFIMIEIVDNSLPTEDLTEDSVGSEETQNKFLNYENEINSISEEVPNICAYDVPIKLETISDNSENSDNSVPNNIGFEYLTNILNLNVGSEETQNQNSLIESQDICEEVSNERQFVCDWIRCKKRFIRKSTLDEHKRCVHLKGRSFKCKYKDCKKLFFSKNYLNRHKRTIHSKERQIKMSRALYQQKLHNQEQNKCRKRSKEISTQKYRHNRTIFLKDRSFQCDYQDCWKRFTAKQNLIVHKLIHSGEKPFVCDHKKCQQRFRHISSLTRHKRTVHSKKGKLKKTRKVYTQDLNRQELNTSNHLIINSENGDNSVLKDIVTKNLKVCVGSEETPNQHFLNNESQNKDISEKVSNKQFVCDWSECGKRFITKSDLIKHKRYVHLKELPFKCDYKDCVKGFTNKQQLRKHKRIIHLKEKQLEKSRDVYKKWLPNQEQIASNQLIGNLNKNDNSVPINILTENLEISVGSEETTNQHFMNNESQSKDISKEVSNKKFVCEFIQCGKRFNTKRAVNQHKRRDHSMELLLEKSKQLEQQDHQKTLNQQEFDLQKEKTKTNQTKINTRGESGSVFEQNITDSPNINCINALSRLVESVDSEDIPHSERRLPTEYKSIEGNYWPPVLFGIFPASLIKSGMSRPVEGSSQIVAIKEILKTIKEAPLNKLVHILPTMEQFIPGFIEFNLLEHNTPEVSLTALYIIKALLERLKSSMTSFLPTIVAVLAKSFGDGRPVIRSSLVQIIHFLINYFPPQQLLDLLLAQRMSDNPRVRVEIINRVIYTALTVPSSFIYPARLCYSVAQMLTDNHQMVRLAALECLAVLGHALDGQKFLLFLSAVKKLENTYHLEGMVAAILVRLARNALPGYGPDGTVRYFLNPQQFSRFSQEADIKWIMMAWVATNGAHTYA